jgi:hypothetical protein
MIRDTEVGSVMAIDSIEDSFSEKSLNRQNGLIAPENSASVVKSMLINPGQKWIKTIFRHERRTKACLSGENRLIHWVFWRYFDAASVRQWTCSFS